MSKSSVKIGHSCDQTVLPDLIFDRTKLVKNAKIQMRRFE